ncbi:MAG: endonuclease III [Verrucomicrobiae bacterium]|nr:endonuclease III [Verrucomicrobiae bacterium]
MPRESLAARRSRTLALIERLRSTYPDAHCELDYSNPLELLVATILSAQCSDKQVNLVTAELFRRYRSAADYAAAPLPDLENALRRLGLFRNKARHIQAACQALVNHHDGRVPDSMDALVRLDGVGRKTANVVLGNAFHQASGIVVDTHVARLARRLSLSNASQPEAIEHDLSALVPRQHWILFSHWLIWHGRRRCAARRPDCPRCELADLCPSSTGPTPDRPPPRPDRTD